MGSKKYRKRCRKGTDTNDTDVKIKVSAPDPDNEDENSNNEDNKARFVSNHTTRSFPVAENEDTSLNGSKKKRKKGNVPDNEDLKGIFGFRYETCLGAQTDATEGKMSVLSNYLVQRCTMGGYRQHNYSDNRRGNAPTYTSVKLRKRFDPVDLRDSFILQNFQFVLPPSGHFAASTKVGVLGSIDPMGEWRPHRICTASNNIDLLNDKFKSISAELLTLEFNDFIDGALQKCSLEQRHKMTAKLEACIDSYDHLIDWDSVLFVVYKGTTLEGCARDFRCPICLEIPIVPRLTKCGHLFCFSCILRSMNAQRFLGIDYGGSYESSNSHLTFGSPQQNMTPLQHEAYRQQQQDRATHLKEVNKKRTCPICSCDIYINDLRPCIFQLIDSVLSDQIVNISSSIHCYDSKVAYSKGHPDHHYEYERNKRHEGSYDEFINSSYEYSAVSKSVMECPFTLVCRRVGSCIVTEGDAYQRHEYIVELDGDNQSEKLVENNDILSNINGRDIMELSNKVLIPNFGSEDAIFSRYSFSTYQLIESQLKSDMLDLRMKLNKMNDSLPRPFCDDDEYEYNATESALILLLRNGYNYSQYSSRRHATFGGSPTLSAKSSKRGCNNNSPEFKINPLLSPSLNRSNHSQVQNYDNSDTCSSKKVTPLVRAVNRPDSTSPLMDELMLPPTFSSLAAGKNNNSANDKNNVKTGSELLWFYQESSGQHVYLHPLNLSMLKMQFSARGHNHSKNDHFNTFSAMPLHLNVRIQEVVSVTQTEDTRRKTREAPHVPLGSTFKVAFVDLPATGLLSIDVLQHFKEPLKVKYQSLRNILRRRNNENLVRFPNKMSSSVAEAAITPNIHMSGDMDSLADLNLTETEIMWLSGSYENLPTTTEIAPSASSTPESRQRPLSSTPLYLQEERSKGSRSISNDTTLFPPLIDITEMSPERSASSAVWESSPNTVSAKKTAERMSPKENTINNVTSESIHREDDMSIIAESTHEEDFVGTGRHKRKKKNKWTLVETKKNKQFQNTTTNDTHTEDSSVAKGVKCIPSAEVAPTVDISECDVQTSDTGNRRLSTAYSSDHHLTQLYDEMEQLAESSSAGTSLIRHEHVKGGSEGPSQRQAKRLEAIIAADRTRISTYNRDLTSSGVSTPICTPLQAPQNDPYNIIPQLTAACSSHAPCQSVTFVKNKRNDQTTHKGSSNVHRLNPFEVLAPSTKKAGTAYHRDPNASVDNSLFSESSGSGSLPVNETSRNVLLPSEDTLAKQEWAMKAATDSYRKLHQKATPHAQPNWTGKKMKFHTASRK